MAPRLTVVRSYKVSLVHVVHHGLHVLLGNGSLLSVHQAVRHIQISVRSDHGDGVYPAVPDGDALKLQVRGVGQAQLQVCSSVPTLGQRSVAFVDGPRTHWHILAAI